MPSYFCIYPVDYFQCNKSTSQQMMGALWTRLLEEATLQPELWSGGRAEWRQGTSLREGAHGGGAGSGLLTC